MPANLAIHRLSARTPPRAQPVAARLALQALGADLEDALPRGLPPQALLWLRRLQLQAPEAALLRPAPAAWRQDWIAAGLQQFDAALAQAARPALGPVPESAPAVLFADAAEMLACLALAAQAGQLDRWWWRGLLGRAWPQWPLAWDRRPEAQAGARRLLDKVGQGGVLAFAGGPVQAAPGDGVAVQPQRDVEQPRQGGAKSEAAATPVPALDARAVPIRRPGAEAVEPPEAGAPLAGLEPEQPTLVAAPVLSQAEKQAPVAQPAARRADAPQRAGTTQAERRAVVAATEVSSPRATPLKAAAPQALSPAAAPAEAARELPASPSTAVPALTVTDTAAPRPTPLAASAPATPAVPEPARAQAQAIAPQSPARRRAPSRSARPTAPSPPTAEPSLPPPLSSPRAGPAAETVWPWPQALMTRQAPLLFIVNALLEDGLYPDFTRPRDAGLPVPLWALLTALSRAWRLPPDALHGALAERTPDWLAPDTLPAAPGASAGPWAPWLVAYARSLRRRLCRRLGLRSARWPQALTLAHPARLWLSEAEWVIEFDLSAHDVAWRLAGLDRDPGWLPSTGVSLRFTFV